jgi:hypothetical protein
MMNPLEQFDLDGEETDVNTRFEITDLDAATWAMRKLKAFDDQDAEYKRVAQTQIDSIQDWLDRKLEGNNQSREYMQGLLTDYLFKQREKDPKFKIDTPYGTVSTRKSAVGVNWLDDKVVSSLEKQGLDDLITIKKSPDKKAIRKAFSFQAGKYVNEDGQVIEGATEKESVIKPVFKFN